MTDFRSWTLVATCAHCGRGLDGLGAAVLRRRARPGPGAVMIDVLGERWPEPGELFHSACFAARHGRRALYAAFVLGRFDDGTGPDQDGRANSAGSDGWSLTATCCSCLRVVGSDRPGLVSDERSDGRWVWVPFLRERRPTPGLVMHPACFVDTYGKGRLYDAFRRDLQRRVGPVVRRVVNVVS